MAGENPKYISVRSRMKAFSFNLIIVIIYLVIGAAIIMAIEKPLEKDGRKATWEKLGTLKIDGGIPLNADHPNAAKFRETLAGDIGCSIKEPGSDYDFDFTGSLFFALTVVTTIGYGNFVPADGVGQFFVAVYSILGLSIILNFMFQSSTIWVELVRGVMQRCCTRGAAASEEVDEFEADITFEKVNRSGSGAIDARELKRCLQYLHGDDSIDESIVAYCMMKADKDKKGSLDRDEFLNALLVYYQVKMELPQGASVLHTGVAVVGIFIWIMAWGVCISAQEGWTLRQGMWYGFVTLTTIGFGDLAPETHLGRLQAFGFIFLGLGMVTWLVSSVYEIWRKYHFWKLQRLYEKGIIGDKYLTVRGHVFRSPLGDPSRPLRWKGFFFQSNASRKPTLSREYQRLISTSGAPPPEPAATSSKKGPKEPISVGEDVELGHMGGDYKPLVDEGSSPRSKEKKDEPLSPRLKSSKKPGAKPREESSDALNGSRNKPESPPKRVKAKAAKKESSPKQDPLIPSEPSAPASPNGSDL
eukprot:Sspe_Gene.107442::Locus_85590_Transcript_2_2_Confidence_0.667_Length_1691::g.107442::m.107442